MNIDDAKALAVRSIHIMGNGTLEEFDELLHPEFLNHEAKDEPPAAREPRPGRLLRHRAVAARRVRGAALGDRRGRRRGRPVACTAR